MVWWWWRLSTNTLTLECHNLGSRMHNNRVCLRWASHDLVLVGHVDDDYLRLVVLLLSNTNEAVWLHGQGGEANTRRIDAKTLELLLIKWWVARIGKTIDHIILLALGIKRKRHRCANGRKVGYLCMLLELYRKYFTHLLLFLPMIVDELECEGSRRRTFFQ